MTEQTDFRAAAYKSISMFVVPFALKWFVILPQVLYWVLFSIGVVLSAFLLWANKKGKIVGKHLTISTSFSIAVLLCILFFPAVKVQAPSGICFELNHSFRTDIEKKANGGDVESMERIGRDYISSYWKEFAKVPKGAKRDDEIFDFRDFLKGERYLNMAAEQDSDEAFYLLGEMKILGLGCIPSRRRAIDSFTHALEINNSNTAVFHAIQTYEIAEEEMPRVYSLYSNWLKNNAAIPNN